MRCADAVADELAHHREPVRLDVLSAPRAPMSDTRAARLHRLDRLVERLLGDPQQRRRLFRHLPDRQRHRAVAEVAVERGADVDRDHVALVQHPPARRDPVDHLLVDRRADRRRVAVIPLERRHRAGRRDPLLRQRVEIRRRHARRDRARRARSAPRRPAGRRRASARAPPADRQTITALPRSRRRCRRAAIAAARSAATASGACAPSIDTERRPLAVILDAAAPSARW